MVKFQLKQLWERVYHHNVFVMCAYKHIMEQIPDNN